MPDEYFLAEDPDKHPEWGFWENGPFGDPDGSMTRQDYLEEVYRRGTSTNGTFAAKLMWHNLPWALQKLREMPQFQGFDDRSILRHVFPGLRAVHVVRRDHVAQAVSWARMSQDGVWVVSETEPAAPVATPLYNFELIAHLTHLIGEAEQGWRQLFTTYDIESHEVIHEDDLVTTSDLRRTVRAIGRWLGQPSPEAGHPLTPRTTRRSDELNEQWVRRFHKDLARQSQ